MTSMGTESGAALRDRLSRHRRPVRRHRWLRRGIITLAVIAGLAVGIRLILDPVATHYTLEGLREVEGMTAEFEKVHVTLAPPGYELRHLKLKEAKSGSKQEPLLYVETARVGLDWRELFHGRLDASLTLMKPKITVVRRASAKKASEPEKEPTGKAEASALSELEESLNKMIPLRVDRIDVVDGEVLLRDTTIETTPEIWVNRINATLKNLATRRELADKRAAGLALKGRLGRSGAIALKLSADPFSRPLRFAGEFSIRDWKLVELYDILKAKADLTATQGTLDLHVKFKVRNNVISGKVKPVLEDVKVESTSEDVGARMKAWVADKALQLSSEDGDERKSGAEIPINGRLDPDEEIGSAVLEVLRNSFAEGVKAGLKDAVKPD
jgi:hypothetical protein